MLSELSAKPIKLGPYTSVRTTSTWLGGGRAGAFSVFRNSGFGLFAEGVALGVLRSYSDTKKPYELSLRFPFAEAGPGAPVERSPLSSLFGLSAVYGAGRITDSSGLDIQSEVLRRLWSSIQDAGGEVGDGKRRYVIFRDPDYSVPHCLRHSSTKSFPIPSEFESLVRQIFLKLTGEGTAGLPLSESSLITFLYEAVRNSHEHGRYDAHGHVVAGIRGIIAEKFIFENAESTVERKDLPAPIKTYLARVWPTTATRGLTKERGKKLFLSFTVSDFGQGVQNTLPPIEGETPWGRLNRAFAPGESRKPRGDDLNRGLGLAKVWRAAARLRAFLFVCSADLIGYRDFSGGSPVTGPLLERAGYTPGRLGTSITLVLPVLPK
jgi:hypothetical protein